MTGRDLEPGVTAIRFATLSAAIVVVEDGIAQFGYLATWVDGRLVECAAFHGPTRTAFHPDVAVSMSLLGYSRWRSGEIGIAEASGTTGTVEGDFPALALGEGLVNLHEFEAFLEASDRARERT